ncbi:16S rRNA (cytosine(1402)-N(4))-methyltransferase RsmH [Nesterenkonia suensis]
MTERAPADRHVPVMRDRCVELVLGGADAVRQAGRAPVVIDATVGMGGHAEAMLSGSEDLRVIGLDRDTQALDLAGRRLAPFGDRFRGVRTVYDRADAVAQEQLAADEVLAGILFDLGVSSLQLDEAERGFAYSYDAPLDMRMDAAADSDDETAAELLARVSESELRHLLKEYGEERFAGRIAARLVARRESAPFTSTADLAAVVDQAVPGAAKRTGGHPAKRTFQALRIAVNRELDVLADAVPRAMDALAPGGRIVVLSYHSLEDRLVKRAITARTKSSAPPGLPVELEEHRPTFRAVTRGAEIPDQQEMAINPRAASAKLRSAEKIGARRITG